jgi:hypothetical protein
LPAAAVRERQGLGGDHACAACLLQSSITCGILQLPLHSTGFVAAPAWELGAAAGADHGACCIGQQEQSVCASACCQSRSLPRQACPRFAIGWGFMLRKGT